MILLRTSEIGIDEIRERVVREYAFTPQQEQKVKEILEAVRVEKDAAVKRYSLALDGLEYSGQPVSEEAFASAYRQVSEEFLAAVHTAQHNITAFHKRFVPRSWIEVFSPGVLMGQLVRPLDRVGIYIPGGTASYPSTVLMTVIPARVAGVEEIILCTPPGNLKPELLITAQEAGVDQVFAVGGVQAIAAMAYGTESIPKVDKICGPGNPYVVLAKKLVYGEVGIEALPGPTEILVVADDSAKPEWIAGDLLSQAEHGGIEGASTCVLVTPSERLAKEVAAEVENQVCRLPRREFAEPSIRQRGYVVLTESLEEATEVVNAIAPEHVELYVEEPWDLVPLIRHCGALLIGGWTPEPVADYVAGPSHVLPTGGTARFASPLSVEDFVKRTSLIHYSERALRQVASDIIAFAQAETLEGHAEAVRLRFKRSSF